jgi:hypothetical protein
MRTTADQSGAVSARRATPWGSVGRGRHRGAAYWARARVVPEPRVTRGATRSFLRLLPIGPKQKPRWNTRTPGTVPHRRASFPLSAQHRPPACTVCLYGPPLLVLPLCAIGARSWRLSSSGGLLQSASQFPHPLPQSLGHVWKLLTAKEEDGNEQNKPDFLNPSPNQRPSSPTRPLRSTVCRGGRT